METYSTNERSNDDVQAYRGFTGDSTLDYEGYSAHRYGWPVGRDRSRENELGEVSYA